MACEHPRDKWVGTAAGICCGVCGQLVNMTAPKAEPVKKAEPAPEPVKKPAPKKGGKK